MVRKSEEDLVDKDRDLKSKEVDGGTPELAHKSDAIAAGIFNPEGEPQSIKGDARPEKRG